MRIKVGKVLKAQGIKGEVKVLCELDDAKMLKHVKKMYLNNNLHEVTKFRADGAFFYAAFSDICDRNAAENLRGWSVYCDKDDLNPGEGRYFIDDIVGCRVTLNDGQTVGEVVEVLQYGAADVYVCKRGGLTVSFPLLKDLVVLIDVNLKSIVLDAKRFGEVSVTDED